MHAARVARRDRGQAFEIDDQLVRLVGAIPTLREVFGQAVAAVGGGQKGMLGAYMLIDRQQAAE